MKTITTHELKKIVDTDMRESIIIDVRSRGEHKGNRIPDVLNIPLDEIHNHIESLKHYKTVYVHCQSGNRSTKACKDLHVAGLSNVVNIEGGISEWESSGFATVKSRSVIPLNRQVFIVAGALILLGVGLSSVNHYFIFISGFVGLGLLFAGVSGWCGMAYLLARMPWNNK